MGRIPVVALAGIFPPFVVLLIGGLGGCVGTPVPVPIPIHENKVRLSSPPPDGKPGVVYLGHTHLEGVPGSRAVSRKTPNGYALEAAIPWARFKVQPEPGRLLPLEWHLLDVDEVMGKVDSSMLWNVFEGKKKPWQVEGMQQWGLLELL